MSEYRAVFPVSAMCRVLEVSTSGYYGWKRRELSLRDQEDAMLTEMIQDIHETSKGTYGAHRIHAALRNKGTRIGRKRAARLMRAAGLVGVTRRRHIVTTERDSERTAAPDLVDRDFTATRPNELWVADATYIPTDSGFLFLAVVLDVFDRKIVGWAMENHLRTELMLAALEMAIACRKPDDVIHHSDQGSQYTSVAFGERCKKAGIRPSTGSVGDCFDNAMCESFFATLECELLDRNRFETKAEARMAIFWFIEGWYNPHRLHSSLGYVSPMAFEKKYYENLNNTKP